MINLSVIKNISRLKKSVYGTTITGNGSGHVMFIVLKGDIGVYKNYKQPGSQMTAKLSAGDMFADPALLRDKKAIYTTVALSDAIILPIDKKDALSFIQDEPAMAFEIIKELSLRLEYAEQQRQNAAPAVSKAAGADGAEAEHAVQTPEPVDIAGAEQETSLAQEQAAQTAASKAGSIAETPESEPSQSTGFLLFPPAHGQYQLTLNKVDSPYLMNKTHTCPICKGSFSSLTVRPSKLVVASTDPDLRYHYKDVEPLYYEVITCPHCFYSALPDVFDTPDKLKTEIQKELAILKNNVGRAFGPEKTADTVFAGFYTALHCAPVSFTNHEIIMGRLLYKLSRVYHDAGDENLENTTAQTALEHFINAYTRTNMSPSQEQQVCITIGELYLKQNDLRNALTYFSKAKSSNSSAVLKNHADSRIYDIRSKAGEQRS